MDNYQRLFSEIRPQKTGIMSVPDFDDFKKSIESGWLKDFFLGVKAYNDKDYFNALIYLDKAIQDNENNPHLYNVRANIKEDNGEAREAICDYKKALYVSGGDWYATYNQIAVNYLNLKDFEKSLIAFDIAIELKQKLIYEGIDENLLPYIQNGVVNRVDFEKMYTNRANVKLSLKDYQGCADDCDRAIESNSEYSNSYFIYGLLFLTVRQAENAYKALKMAEMKGHKQASTLIKQFFNN